MVGTNLTSFGITDVAPSSDFAGFGYLSPMTGAVVIRIIYQTTNGDIRSAFHLGLNGAPNWVLDATIIDNVPLGTPISAYQQDIDGLEVLMLHYTDVNGRLTQRFSTVDTADWSAPLTLNT